MSVCINSNTQISGDLNKALSGLKTIVERGAKKVYAWLNNANYYSKQEVSGGTFVSTIEDDLVISMFYHPSKKHSATAEGLVKSRSEANPGEWAIAVTSKAMFGNRSYYNTDP